MNRKLIYGTPLLLAAGLVYLLGDSECSGKEDSRSTSSVPVYSSEEAENGERMPESQTPILPHAEIETGVPSAENGSSSPLEERAVTSEQERISAGEPRPVENASSFIDSYVEACGNDLARAFDCILLAEADSIPSELIAELRTITRGGRGFLLLDPLSAPAEAMEMLQSWEQFGDFPATQTYQELQEMRAAFSLEIRSIPGYDVSSSYQERIWALHSLLSLQPAEITQELFSDLEEIAQNEWGYDFPLYLAQSLLRGYEKYGNFSTSDPACEACPEDDVWHGRFFAILELLFSLPRESEEGSLSEEDEALIAETLQYVQEEMVNHDANPFVGGAFGGIGNLRSLHPIYSRFESNPWRHPSLPSATHQERLYPNCPPF